MQQQQSNSPINSSSRKGANSPSQPATVSPPANAAGSWLQSNQSGHSQHHNAFGSGSGSTNTAGPIGNSSTHSIGTGRKAQEESWRAPGSGSRRASHSSVVGGQQSSSPLFSYTAAGYLSPSPVDPRRDAAGSLSPSQSPRSGISHGQRSSPALRGVNETVTMPAADADEQDDGPIPPMQQLFGNSRQYGQRSYSYSAGQQPDEDDLLLPDLGGAGESPSYQIFSNGVTPSSATSIASVTGMSRSRNASFVDVPPPGFVRHYSASSPAFQLPPSLSQQQQQHTSPMQQRRSSTASSSHHNDPTDEQYDDALGPLDMEEEIMRARAVQRIRSRSHSCAQILSEMSPEMVEEMLLAIQHQQAVRAQQQQHLAQQPQSRFVPAQTWTTDNGASGGGSRMRRYSAASSTATAAAVQKDELATRYFNGDPALMERRHSIAAAMATQEQLDGSNMNNNNAALNGAMQKLSMSPNGAHMQQQQLQQQQIPGDFAHQYGSLLEAGFPDQPTTTTSNGRSRSNTEPSHGTASRSAINFPPPMSTMREQSAVDSARQQSTTNDATGKTDARPRRCLLYIVEFKGGRNEFYMLPTKSQYVPTVGDLVIVEADRGQDLGKCVAALTTADDIPPSVHLSSGMKKQDVVEVLAGNTSLNPKAIMALASGDDVTQLLDKARDEAKALTICQAKSRQKGLPMEIVDVEYQWDRRKLTIYFLAENRIDFREYVRDLFKIYKTRIWMCAVERSGPGIRLLVSSQA